MVCRELCLPAGVSVLHVEQEVTGDNTLALDSVLECDTERVQLLAREGELLASGDKDTAAGRSVYQGWEGGKCFKYSKITSYFITKSVGIQL